MKKCHRYKGLYLNDSFRAQGHRGCHIMPSGDAFMPGFSLSIVLSFAAAAAPAADACSARAGAISGAGSTLPLAVSGELLKKSHAIEKFRKKAKDGRTLVIEGGDFTAYDFRKAKLSNICFRGVKLANTDWSGATATGMGFIDSDLSGSIFTGAIMRGALFRTTTMANVDATAADFSEGRLDGGRNASIKNLKLDLAKMNNFRFICGTTAVDGCPFERQGISARNTDFSGALFEGFALWGSKVDGALFDGADMAIEDVGQIIGGAEPNVINVRHAGMSTLVDGPVAMALAGALTTSSSVASKCSAPATALETAFCEDKSGQLFAFDSDVIRLVASGAPQKKKAVVAFENSRNLCLTQTVENRILCLTRIYRARRNALLATTAPMTWMKRAQKILFVRNDLALASGATLQPSWPGVAQVLVRLSPSYMLARVESGKRVSVRGLATGTAPAACSIQVATAAGGSGVFNAPVLAPGKKRPVNTPLFRVVGEQAILTTAQDDSLTPARVPICNGAASFGTMKRLPIDMMTFESLWASTKAVSPPASAPAPVVSLSSPPPPSQR
jgi:uncharacterized protein YjbI with pentapeptide repeats